MSELVHGGVEDFDPRSVILNPSFVVVPMEITHISGAFMGQKSVSEDSWERKETSII